MKNTVYFTICSANYLAHALTLAQSIGRMERDCTLHVFLADRLSPDTPVPGRNIELIPVESIAIDGMLDMAFRYTVLEFNTAVKPYCFQHLLCKGGFEAAIYLDPDILVIDSLVHVTDALEAGASCVLTPHITEGIKDGKYPNEDTYLTCGVFNLGFAAFSNSDEALSFLRWWAGKTRRDCLVAFDKGIFTDQSYCNLAPCFMDNFVTLRNKGYNLAYWNLKQRELSTKEGKYCVEGEPLRFVHFSGIVPGKPRVYSKHQNRYTRNEIGLLNSIMERYFESLWYFDKHSAGFYSQTPYAFGLLTNGDKIHPLMRAAYRKSSRESFDRTINPFELDHTFFSEPDPDYPRFNGAYVSRLCASLWESKDDLRRRFDIRTDKGQFQFNTYALKVLSGKYQIRRKYFLPTHSSSLNASMNRLCDNRRRIQIGLLVNKAAAFWDFLMHILRTRLMGKSP